MPKPLAAQDTVDRAYALVQERDPLVGATAVVDAVCRLRAEGHDVPTIAALIYPAWTVAYLPFLRLLHQIEWGGDDLHYICPVCQCSRGHGHARDCALAALLAPPPAVES